MTFRTPALPASSPPALPAVVLCAALVAVSGCGVAGRIVGALSRGSSESSYYPMVNSAQSALESSQSISGTSPEAVARRYHADVCTYTATAARASRGDPETFLRGLGEVAMRYRLTDWDKLQSTYMGIGCGIVRAELSRSEAYALVSNLAGGSAERREAIGWGIRLEQERRRE
jgi:hypothetical protein